MQHGEQLHIKYEAQGKAWGRLYKFWAHSVVETMRSSALSFEQCAGLKGLGQDARRIPAGKGMD